MKLVVKNEMWYEIFIVFFEFSTQKYIGKSFLIAGLRYLTFAGYKEEQEKELERRAFFIALFP